MLDAPLRSADDVARSVASIIRPPRRIRPSTSVDGKLQNDRDVLDLSIAPYLVEPLDRFADRAYQGIVFVGPARTGKTFGLAIAAIDYAVEIAPADILAIYMSQDTARDFSKGDLDRTIRHTPSFAGMLSPRARDDNVYDKFFRNGIALKIGWPAATQLRGKTVRYVLLMDYDGSRAGDVDGRGSMWGQARKRIETYMSRGKCLAESSPGFEYDEASWMPRTPHEAPPAKGIASLYNAGTRARWYWPCQHCGQHFQARPGLEPFLVPKELDEIEAAIKRRDRDLMTLAESWAKVPCPHCGALHEPAQRSAMNRVAIDRGRVVGATWLHQGQELMDGIVSGRARRTDVVSYWLGGVAAAYQPWIGLVHTYLTAVEHYLRTGDESEMRRSSFEDQAWPYLPLAVRRRRSADHFADRKESWDRGTAPPGVRFVTAQVDVQARRFVVQVHGWGRGLESWVLDRFQIFASERREEDGRVAPLNPAAFKEDWDVLRAQVLERSYLVQETGVALMPRLTLCDSGGADGVTDKAYEFWRRMRDAGLGHAFMLVKGTGYPTAPRVQQAWPDARNRKDRSAGRGDVPVWILNANLLKDGVAGDLARTEEGPGFVHVPEWIDDDYFSELTAETRTAKGWQRLGQMSNEAFDLHAYGRAACIILGAEGIDWNNPPEWAADPARVRTQAAPAPAKSTAGDWLKPRRGSFW